MTSDLLTRLETIEATLKEIRDATVYKPTLIRVSDDVEEIAVDFEAMEKGHYTLLPSGCEIVNPAGYRYEIEIDGRKTAFQSPTKAELLSLIDEWEKGGER